MGQTKIFNDLNDINTKINYINLEVTEENNKSSQFINFFKSRILNLTSKMPENFAPFINGYYMIFMVNGPWFNKIISLNQNKSEITTEMSEISSSYKYHSGTGSFSSNEFANTTIPMLATDIDLPEPTKEYINVSMRSQSINAYQRELIVPDFSIQYIENDNLDVIRYHEVWHKTIELYRRGYIESDDNRNVDDIFYDVPYSNSLYVLLLSPSYDVRGIFYLPGIKPVNLPIKQLLGNRNSPKITTYNFSYKGTSMFYKFYNSNDAFLKEFNENTDSSKLAFKFKQDVVNNSKSDENKESNKLNNKTETTLNSDVNVLGHLA